MDPLDVLPGHVAAGPDVGVSPSVVEAGLRFAMAMIAPPRASARVQAAQVFELEARARLSIVQARKLESEILESEVRVEGLDTLPGRFDLVLLGARGSGKSRFIDVLVSAARGAGVPCSLHDVRESGWPDLDQVGGLVVLEEAGSSMAGARAELPEGAGRMLSDARSRDVSTLWCAQHSNQVPLSLLRHGVGLVVTAAPWSWRATAREEMRDRLDEAHRVLRRAPPRSVAYVDADGWVTAMQVPPAPPGGPRPPTRPLSGS